jgi:hypothetical protein
MISIERASRLKAMLAKLAVVGAFTVAVGFALTGPAAPARADAATLSDFPLVVRCALLGTDRVFYLSTVRPDGVAVYISPDRLSGVITTTGTPIKVSATEGSGSCAGKTIDELRRSHQAFDVN